MLACLGLYALGERLETAEYALDALQAEHAAPAKAAPLVEPVYGALRESKSQRALTKVTLAAGDDAGGHARRLHDLLAEHPAIELERFDITDGAAYLRVRPRLLNRIIPRAGSAFRDALWVSPFRRHLQLTGVPLASVEFVPSFPQKGFPPLDTVMLIPPETCSNTDPWGVAAEALAEVLKDFPTIRAHDLELLPDKGYAITLDVSANSSLREVARLRDALKTSDLARGRCLSFAGNLAPAIQGARRSLLRLIFAYPGTPELEVQPDTRPRREAWSQTTTLPLRAPR